MNYAFQLPQRCFIFKNQLCNLLPGIAAIAGQFVMAGIWSAVAHRWYYKEFPPQPTTVVYDVRRDDARFRLGYQDAASFDWMRKHYPERREWSSLRVQGSSDPRLTALGFTVI